MAAAMLIFVHILANAAVEYDIKGHLEREVYKNMKEVSLSDTGQVVCSEDFCIKNEDIVYLILDSTGKVLVGEYPPGCPTDIAVGKKKLRQVSVGMETY